MSAIGSAPRPTTPRTRRTLLSSCAVASALAVLGHSTAARAQEVPPPRNGYNATISGADSVNYFGATGANQAAINLTGANSVITFVPTDTATGGGSINFQDAGGVTTFVGPRGATDYTVLNRVIPVDPTRSITFNGTTNGTLFDGSTGGNIWFYSPGGIIASPTASFNVGSLLLSTNAIGYESGYGVTSPLNPNQISFTGPAGSQSAIEIQNNANGTAQLNASGAGANYVALIAPRVVQGGTVRASQVAYVAAETGDLTRDMSINSGLFSIAVTVGTTATAAVGDAAVSLDHNGITELTASAGALNRAFMVAVPKNSAITMLVGGAVTYASAATVVDGAVVLSTGNISDGLNGQAFNANPGAVVGGSADIVIGLGGQFTSINAASRNNISTLGNLTVTGNVNLFGRQSVAFGGDASTVAINQLGTLGGNLNLTSFTADSTGARTGGTTSLYALNGADVRIAGGVTLDSSGAAQSILVPSLVGPLATGTDGQGGNATLTMTGSTLTIGNSLSLLADGVGLNGGIGTGGNATLDLADSALTVGFGAGGTGTGGLTVSASGTGGFGSVGGTGQGGTAAIDATGLFRTEDTSAIALSIAGSTTVSASGFGGGTGNGGTGGTGTGGLASINLDATFEPIPGTGNNTAYIGQLTTAGPLTVAADGFGGGYDVDGSDSANGGGGTGGIASIALNFGQISAGATMVSATGIGASAPDTFGSAAPGSGGDGSGGVASFTKIFSSSTLASLSVSASGAGGAGGASNASEGSGYGSVGGTGGSGIGGRAVFDVDGTNRTFDVLTLAGDLVVDASGTGGTGGASASLLGGAGGGGTASSEGSVIGGTSPLAGDGGSYVNVDNSASVNFSSPTAGPNLTVSASGRGGIGGQGLTGYGDGGVGQGGSASLSLLGGTVTSAPGVNASVLARGDGGGSGVDPDGEGRAGTGTAGFGTGGTGLGGGHGTTVGGATVLLNTGALEATSLTVDGGALGGAGNLRGGDALAGESSVGINGGLIRSTTTLNISADATGGGPTTSFANTADGARGGDATGGTTSLMVSGGSVTLANPLTLSADATGGSTGFFGTYGGGAATGGAASLASLDAGDLTLTGAVTVSASASGGDANFASGGAATGGAASVLASGGAITADSLTVNATADGGGSIGDSDNPHDGGAATGGLATLSITPALGGTAGSIDVTGATLLDASARGGLADENGYGALPITPASGGAGTGGGFGTAPGGAIVDIQTGVATLAGLTLNAAGFGGDTAAGGATGTGRGGLTSISVGTVGQPGGQLTATGILLNAFGDAGEHASSYGDGGVGGIGIGGRAVLNLVGGTLTSTGAIIFDATGLGGRGSDEDSFNGRPVGDGGVGIGGSATIDVADAVLTTTGVTARADGIGGAGGSGQSGVNGIGGAGIGGGAVDSVGAALTAGVGARATVTGATGAILLSGNLSVSSDGTGGQGGTGDFDAETGAAGGVGLGGRAEISASTGGNIGLLRTVGQDVLGTVSARGTGGTGGGTAAYSGRTAVPLGGVGGDGRAGLVSLSGTGGGTINLGNIALAASATGGAGASQARGGNAFGGTASIEAASGTVRAVDPAGVGRAASVVINTSATAGSGGGSATGGLASLSVTGTGTYEDDMFVDISAVAANGVDGHYGVAGGDGGNATAGAFTLDLASGTIDGLSINAIATAGRGGNAVEAGYGAAGGAGGNASGGPISIATSDGATINFADIMLDATRTAGSGGNGSSGADGFTGAPGINGQLPPSTVGLNGGTGGAGGAGQAGGAGGRGGNATGASVTLTAAQGALTFDSGEGTTLIDLSATAGNGGIGAAGGNGGAGGPGGAPAGTGTAGAAGAQGVAGAGGSGGAGGNAAGGNLMLAADGGTLSFDSLRIVTDANGGNGATGGNSGGGTAPTGGITGAGGTGTAGSVTLATSDRDDEGTPIFGRIIGGDLAISANGNGGFAGDFSAFGEGVSGRIALIGDGRYLSDDATPVGSLALSSLDIQAFGSPPLGFSSPDDALAASVDLLARNGRISITGDATIQTSYHASLRVEDGGAIDVGGALDVFGGNYVTATQTTGGESPANLISARSVSFASGGDVIADAPIRALQEGDGAGTISMTGNTVQASDLVATNAISLRGSSFVRAGNLATTALVDPDATDLAEAGGGTITLTAGENLSFGLLPDVNLFNADVEVTGTVSASNSVNVTAGGDVRVLGGAQILSDNFVGIDAGDDVTIQSGAAVRAALAPLADPAGGTGPLDLGTPAGLVITAGRQPVANPTPGDFATVVIGGDVSSGVFDGAISGDPASRRGILIAGGAVQSEGGTIAGRSLTVLVDNAPLPDADRTGGVENLTGGCLLGDVCLGAVDLTDQLTVGPLTGTVDLPSTVRIAAGSQTLRTSIRSQGDILLGGGEGTTTFGGSELLRVQSTLGAVRLTNNTVLSGGTAPGGVVQVLGEAGIDGPGGTIQSDGDVGLYTGSGGLELASLIAGGQLNTLNADLSTARSNGLTVDGAFTINSLLSVDGGDAIVDATGDVSVNRVQVGDGATISLASTDGSVNVSDATGSNFGTAGNVFVNSTNGTATLLAATAQGTISIVAGQRAEGGRLDATDIEVISTAGDASIDQGFASRDIFLSAAGIASANFLNAGDDILIEGARVVFGDATTTGGFLETGYGADGSNITVNATGAIDVNNSASAFDTLRLTSSAGRVTANQLSAGDDAIVTGNGITITSVVSRGTSTESGYGATPDGSNIRLTATGIDDLGLPALQVTSANSANDLFLTSAGTGSIAATSLIAARDIIANGGGAINVTGGNAARDLSLTSTGGAITAPTLIAGRDLSANAGGAIGVTAATAGRDLLLISTGAGVTGTTLVAGGDAGIFAAGNVTLGDVTANGPVELSGNPNSAVPVGGVVSIRAGRAGTTGTFAAADLTINGTVSANGLVEAAAGRDILVGGSGKILSDNRVSLVAGDDIRIAAGAEVRAALDPVPVRLATTGPSGTIVSPAGLILNAGGLALGYTAPTGNVAALVIDGTISSAGRPMTLSGGAIQAPNSVLEAGTLAISVPNAPAAGAAQSNDNGGLTTCLQGDVCLGTIALSGFTADGLAIPGILQIGRGTSPRPTNVRITGPVAAGTIEITALNGIALGTAGGTTPIAQTATGRIDLTALAGAVDLLGNLTLTGGASEGSTFGARTVAIDAGTDVNGATAQVVSRGPLQIFAGRSVTLLSTRSGEATRIDAAAGDISLGSATSTVIEDSGDGPGSGVILTAGNDVTVTNVDATGDLFVRAGGDVDLASIVTRTGTPAVFSEGSDIDIDAGGSVLIGTATAADDAFITAGTSLTLTALTANGETTNDGADLGGNITLEAGGINAGSLTAATDITATADDLLRIDNARAAGTIDLFASGTDLPPATGAPDGVLAVELGTVDAGTDLLIGAPNGGIRFASLSAPRIALQAGTRIAGGDATARDGDIDLRAPGDILLGDATATDSIFVTAGGSVLANSLTSSNAEADPAYRAIEIVAGGTIDVTGAATAFRGDVDFTADGNIAIGDASAGDTVLLASNGGSVTAGALVSGTFPEGADFDEEFRGAIGVVAAGDATIGSANALSDIGILSREGGITIGDVTAGNNALLLAATDVTTGAVQVSDRFYIANAAMAEFLGEDLDPAGLDGRTPFATAGGVTLNGDVTAGTVTIAAGDRIALGQVSSTGTTSIGSLNGAIGRRDSGDEAAITAGGDVLLATTSSIDLDAVAAGGRFAADGYGDQDYGSITAATDVNIRSFGAVRASFISAGDDIEIGANSASIDEAITTGLAEDTLGSGDLPAFPIAVPGPVDPDPIDPEPPVEPEPPIEPEPPVEPPVAPLLAAPALPDVTDGANIRIATFGDARLSVGTAQGSITLSTPAGRIDSDQLVATGLIDARSNGGDISFGDAGAGRSITLFTDAGGIGAVTLIAGDYIDARARDDVFFDSASAGAGVFVRALEGGIFATRLDSGTADPEGGDDGVTLLADSGDINVATIVSGDDIRINAGGDVDVGAALADVADGMLGTGGGDEITSDIVIEAGGALTLARGEARESIRLASGGAMDIGTLAASGAIVLLPATDLRLASATTPGLFYVANRSMRDGLGEDFDPALLAGATPVPTGGAVTITGTVSAGPVTIAAGNALDFATILSTDTVALSSATGSITGDIVRAAGDISLAAAGAVRVTTDIATPGTIGATGTGIALNTLGDLRIGTVNATAGDVALTSTGGAITVDTAAATGRVVLGSGGTGVNGTPDDRRSITAGTIRAGTDATVNALGAIDIGTATAGGSILLSSATTTAIDSGTAGRDIQAYGQTSVTAGTLTAGRDLELVTRYITGDTRVLPRSVTLGSGTAGDDIVLAAFGAVAADTLTTTGAGEDAGAGQYDNRDGSSVYVISEQGTTIGSVASTDAIDYLNVAQTIGDFAISDGSGGINVASQTAGGDITAFNGASDIVFGTATAGGSIDLTAGSDVRGGISADSLRAGGAINASASGDVGLTSARAVDAISVESTGGSVTSTDLLATNSITVRALGSLFVRDAIATAGTGNVSLAAGFPFAGGSGAATAYLLDGNATVTGTVSAGRAVRIEGGGDVLIGGEGRVRSDGTIVLASGDDIIVDAGGVIGLGHINVPAPGTFVGDRVGGPSDSVTLNAGLLRAGTANPAGNGASGIVMNGTVDGVQIALLSETIGVGAAGRVGSSATTLANYTNNGTGLTTVGGSGEAAGYAVSSQVLGRTRAQAIRVTGATDVTVQAFNLAGSAATDGNLVGDAASFEIQTPGSVRVEGAATISSAAQTDLFAITAGDRITVITPTGSIALRDANNALAGRLRLAGQRITVATAAGAAAIDGLAGVDAKDARLGMNDGTLSDAGFLLANAMEFRISNGLYIQNSGNGLPSAMRRGFTAGTGGISIVTTGTTPAEIVINGRQAAADGSFTTGANLIPLVRLSGTGTASMASFDPRSTVNGCLIVGATCQFDVVTPPPPPPPPPPEEPLPSPPSQPVQDVINALIDGQDNLTGAISSVVQQLNSPLIELIDFTPFRLSGIIDEPVTGAGNDDFYTTFGDGDGFGTGVTINEQVTGSGNDDLTAKAEKDGKCDPNQSATDPDCN